MAEPKVVFCIRIKGINKLAPKPRMILQLFRLRQLHNGVFIRVNKATMQMLQAVQPFVTYGYPSLSTIRKLIYKRGYGEKYVPDASAICVFVFFLHESYSLSSQNLAVHSVVELSFASALLLQPRLVSPARSSVSACKTMT